MKVAHKVSTNSSQETLVTSVTLHNGKGLCVQTVIDPESKRLHGTFGETIKACKKQHAEMLKDKVRELS